MARYVYRGELPRSFDTLGLVLEHGQEFNTDEEVNHPDIELVHDQVTGQGGEE